MPTGTCSNCSSRPPALSPDEVLLLGGAMSARNLTAALDGLSAVLPRARRVTLPGTGHTAADNGGKPELVAAQLRAFFS